MLEYTRGYLDPCQTTQERTKNIVGLIISAHRQAAAQSSKPRRVWHARAGPGQRQNSSVELHMSPCTHYSGVLALMPEYNVGV